MGEGHFSPDPLGSSNLRASKQLKMAKNCLLWQFLTIWHSVDQFFGWNQLDHTQKSMTIHWGKYFKSRSSHILASEQLKTGWNGLFWPILTIWHSVDQLFGWNTSWISPKNHWQYTKGGILGLNQVGSSHIWPQMAYLGSFCPFDTL